jgi:hypothetical protein
MKKKYIVSSGCSYGITMSSIFDNPINRYGDNGVDYKKPFSDFKFDTIYEKFCDDLCYIEVSLASQSSEYISDSIIHTINSLLKSGISTEDIYVFVEWTEYDRIAVHQEKYIKSDEIQWRTNINTNQWEFCENNIQIFNSELLLALGKVGNLLYLNPTHTCDTLVKQVGTDVMFWHKESIEYELKIPQITKLKKYIDNILKTQNFLKLHNIKYNFAFMQSEFSSWIMDKNSLLGLKKYRSEDHKPYIRIDHPDDPSNGFKMGKVFLNKNYNPTASINEDIEIVFPELKTLFDQIDLNNFWFYENDKYRRGGIDEWCIDKYGMYGYFDDNFDFKSAGYVRFIPEWGNHPNKILYSLLYNEMCFNNPFFKVRNEWVNYINEKYNEDIEYSGITKNYLTYSHKYIINNYVTDSLDGYDGPASRTWI